MLLLVTESVCESHFAFLCLLFHGQESGQVLLLVTESVCESHFASLYLLFHGQESDRCFCWLPRVSVNLTSFSCTFMR